jgi:hypothetical protein
MFPAHFRKKLNGWSCATLCHVFKPTAEPLGGLLKILAFPFEVRA